MKKLKIKADLSLGAVGVGYVGNLDDRYFYPNIGHKKVFVADECRDGLPFGDKETITFQSAVFKDDKTPVPDFNVLPGGPISFKNGYAKFLLEGNSNVVPQTDANGDPRPISLRFKIDASEDCKTYPDKGGYSVELGEIIIKNNSNTTVAEVLEGKGVFVQQNAFFTQNAFDPGNATEDNYRKDGRSYGREENGRTVLEEQDQYLDYVQYMLNMVAIPLRTPVQESSIEYLITPDGKYGGETATVVEALMEGGVFSTSLSGFTIKSDLNVISHHREPDLKTLLNNPVEAIKSFGRLYLTFDKLRRDYQRDEVTNNIDLEIPVNPFVDPPGIPVDELKYQVITPEAFRGVNATLPLTDQAAALVNNQGNFMAPRSVGLYQLFKHYDWDGDGLSNLAEVENATQYNNTGGVIVANNVFDPLNQADSALGQLLKGTYSRGNVSVTGSSDAPRGPGLGELSAANGADVSGLRLPTFGPGFYDFPNNDPLNVDAYTSLRVLNLLESAGRRWVNDRPDTYPLEANPLVHNTQGDPAHAGNSRFGLNDLSGRAGGINRNGLCNDFELRNGRTIPYTCNLGHASHHNGLDMDIRYVRNDNTESVVVLGVDDNIFDAQATIDLINAITNDGSDLSLLIVGDAMDPDSRSDIDDAFLNTTIIENRDHNNHIHIRLAAGQNGIPDPSRFTVISDTQLAYVQDDSAASTHTIDFQTFDLNGNPLLPWTRLSYQPQNANITGRNLVNNTLYDPERVWVNIDNQANRQGYGSVQVECQETGEVNITLSDAGGNNVGTISAQCQ